MDELKKVEQTVEKQVEKDLNPNRFVKFVKRLGPGLVTGAADDDPSGIGTYTQAGAAFGYSLAWMMPFMLPMMIAVQEMAGRIGIVTGKGLASVMKENYSRWFLYGAVFFLVFANTVNIGADIGAMAASAQLLINIPYVWWTLFFTAAIVLLELIVPYKQYAKILKWLCLSLFAYVITAFMVQMPWREVLHSMLIPTIKLDPAFIMMIVALLGTTISPYLFFWEPSQEVEEQVAHQWRKEPDGAPLITEHRVKGFRKDNAAGMVLSQIVAFFILITAAATLHSAGILNVSSTAQAAKALEPLVKGFPNAGLVAKSLFAIGVIGTGMLAIPVLAGSAGYAVSEALDLKEGLYRKVGRARGFYAIIAGATLTGLLINFSGIDPIKALYYSAVVNGVMAVPLIFVIVRIGNNKKIMGDRKNSKLSNAVGIFTFLVMLLASLGMVFIH